MDEKTATIMLLCAACALVIARAIVVMREVGFHWFILFLSILGASLPLIVFFI